jgi:3',5'-cyclic AMP phosphodiesterase CpdA
MRILHFSDVHLDIPVTDIPLTEWFGKRLIGGANLVLNRRKHFQHVARKLELLDEFRREQQVDLMLNTGDFTVLGTEPEYAAAHEAVAPMYSAPLGFVSIPGNHDLYMPNTVRHKRFERHFGDTMTTDRPDLAVDGPWPFVRFFGPEVAVVGVNSSRPNPEPWRSNGRIPDLQLEGLRRVLSDPEIADRFVFIMTHYAPCLSDGQPDRPSHGMVNSDAFLQVCAPVERGAILCGHVHHCYRVRVPDVGPEVFCAGSATINDRAGFWMFDVDGRNVTARKGSWDGKRFVAKGSGDGLAG